MRHCSEIFACGENPFRADQTADLKYKREESRKVNQAESSQEKPAWQKAITSATLRVKQPGDGPNPLHERRVIIRSQVPVLRLPAIEAEAASLGMSPKKIRRTEPCPLFVRIGVTLGPQKAKGTAVPTTKMKIRQRNILLLPFLSVVLLCVVSLTGQDKTKPQDTPKYRNPNLTVDERVADLLPRMTLEEKVEQISGGSRGRSVEVIDPTGTFTNEQAKATLAQWGDPDLVFPAKRAAILRNGIQRYLREKTRLGIPSLFMGEALHGFMEYGSTSFPQALGLASTWDPELVHQVFTAAGDEAGSSGAGQVFSPLHSNRLRRRRQ